jgi:hypothetical protein
MATGRTETQEPWDPLDQAVDKAVIAGRLTPGICEIVGANSPRAWDEQSAYAVSGARLVFHGKKLSHFTIKFHLYDKTDWADWNAFQPLVYKVPTPKNPRALSIWHPLLVPLGIGAIVIEEILVPEQTDDGVWTIELKVIEYRKAREPALAKPEAATATPVDPDDLKFQIQSEAYADRIAQLMAK